MSGLLAFSRVVDAVNERIGKWVAWLLVLAILVSTVNAGIRKIFSTSSNSWLEMQWYLFGAVFLLCASWTLIVNEHIRIDIVNNMFSRRVRNWVEVVGHTLFLLPFAALSAYYAWPFVEKSMGMALTSGAFALLIFRLLVAIALAVAAIAAVVVAYRGKFRVDHIATWVCAPLIYFAGESFLHLVEVWQAAAPRFEVSMNAGGLVVWPAKLLILVGFILLTLQGISELIKRLAIMLGMMEDNFGGGHHAAAEAEAERLLKQAEQDGLIADQKK